jgi:hypothetical protein
MTARTNTPNRSSLSNRLALSGGTLLALTALATPALAVPQIEVRINNQVITTNQKVSFDDTELGQTTPLIVVIRNIGNQDLVFTGNPFVSLGGGFDTYFSIIQPPLETGNKLSPNSSTAFRVDFPSSAAASARA